MSFIFEPLRKYANFKGRARRAEFWQFFLLVLGVLLVGSGTMGLAGAVQGDIGFMVASMILALLVLGLLIPNLAVAVRRLHDTGMSGWWLLIGLIPYLGQLALLVFYVIDGNRGENRFGPDPKGRDREILVTT